MGFTRRANRELSTAGHKQKSRREFPAAFNHNLYRLFSQLSFQVIINRR
jgi:hypothetical protein